MTQDVAAPSWWPSSKRQASRRCPSLLPTASRPSPRPLPSPSPPPLPVAAPAPAPRTAAAPVAAPSPTSGCPRRSSIRLPTFATTSTSRCLPIFLEEAAELYPQAGDQVRAWRRNPRDDAVVAAAAPHAAHVQGQRTDGRRDAPGRARAPDGIAADDGDSPRLADRRTVRRARQRPGRRRLRARRAARGQDQRHAAALRRAPPAPAPVAGAASARRGLPRRRARRICRRRKRTRGRRSRARSKRIRQAMLRVRADVIDRLVNEAGEVPIARSRVEGELRALKANLLELTASVIRLRSQVREIEIQAESQIQSRMSTAQTVAPGFRPAGVRPLHALPGTDAVARRRRQRRIDRPAVAAEEPRRRRRGAAGAGAAVARRAAAAVRDSHGAVRQPVRASVPDPARDRARARQARQPRDPRHADRARPLGAGEARRPARAPVAQRARPRHRSRATRAWRPASRKPARSRSLCGRSATKS